MSALFARLQQRYTQGLALPAPDLWPDARATGITSFKPAAVLVAVVERDEPGLLLIHRPDHMRAHPGQVALPGGRCDPGETAAQAALREAHEELGIEPAQVRIIGPCDTLRTGTGYAVTPVLAMVPPDLPLVPNPREVDRWFEAPLGFVLDRANHQANSITLAGETRRFVEMDWQGHRIWGVTGAILANLAARLNWHD
jgi:8-oxo-dGTP pyrophosphatase MutT (NUDIX family)